MQIDKIDAAKKTAIIATAIGVTVAAPYAAPYVLWAMSPLLVEIGKVGLETVKGVGSNALWDLRSSFEVSHENEDLTRLLGRAYASAIADILTQAEDNQVFGNSNNLIKYILPTIKKEIDAHLATGKEIDLLKLFPTKENLAAIEIDGQKKLPFYRRFFGKQPVEYQSVIENLLAGVTAEEFILNISDDGGAAKKLVAEEVEITLRRWFVQLNPKLAKAYTFPPSLDKFVFEQIGELIPQKINRLVKQDDLEHSWKAFQRSHLQAILSEVKNHNNGLSENDRKLLEPLGEFLDKLSENNELIAKLSNGTAEILSRVGESEENIKNCIAEESGKLQNWLEKRFDDLFAVGNETLETVKEIKESLSNIVSPFPGEASPNFVALPTLQGEIYGRDKEIKAIIEFLKTEKEHLIIAAMTCLGKTSLLTKFLNQNLNAERNASLLPDVFTKVIYLDCRKYGTFAGIAQHFATLLQTSLEFETGKEEDFLKLIIFPKIKNDKILLVLDNFEEWQTDGRYKTREIGVFLNTILHQECSLRMIILSWHLPHREIEFTAKVAELDFIKEKLEKGLEHADAVEFVRQEGKKYCKAGSPVDLDKVSEADLRVFFTDVHYIPQAIQSMVHFIGRKRVTFRQFTTDYREIYRTEERDATDLEEKRGNLLRPTNAMINLQISLLNENAKNLLRHAAFYGIDVPEEILIADESDASQKSETQRDELIRLSNDRLIIPALNSDDGEPFMLYHLHPFVLDAVRENLPVFAKTHEAYLKNIGDLMEDKTLKVWENKLFYRQLALVECWERIEDYFIESLNKTTRQYLRDFVDFRKALASQEIAAAFSFNLTADQKNNLMAKSEKLYLDYLKKYPNYAAAYCNLGIVLAQDEKRYTEAEMAYRKAIKLNSNNANTYYNLGVLLVKDKNRHAEAETAYWKVIELNPNYADAYFNLGNLLAKDKNRWAEAETAYRRAIDLNPNDAEAYYNLGVLLTKDENRYAEAETVYQTAIELNLNYAEAYGNLAWLKAKSVGENAKEEILECLSKCLELNPAHRDLIKNNPAFEFLRDDARFKEIVGD